MRKSSIREPHPGLTAKKELEPTPLTTILRRGKRLVQEHTARNGSSCLASSPGSRVRMKRGERQKAGACLTTGQRESTPEASREGPQEASGDPFHPGKTPGQLLHLYCLKGVAKNQSMFNTCFIPF